MSEEAKNYIAAVIHTMDKITVSGEDNLDMMPLTKILSIGFCLIFLETLGAI